MPTKEKKSTLEAEQQSSDRARLDVYMGRVIAAYNKASNEKHIDYLIANRSVSANVIAPAGLREYFRRTLLELADLELAEMTKEFPNHDFRRPR